MQWTAMENVCHWQKVWKKKVSHFLIKKGVSYLLIPSMAFSVLVWHWECPWHWRRGKGTWRAAPLSFLEKSKVPGYTYAVTSYAAIENYISLTRLFLVSGFFWKSLCFLWAKQVTAGISLCFPFQWKLQIHFQAQLWKYPNSSLYHLFSVLDSAVLVSQLSPTWSEMPKSLKKLHLL